MEVGKDIFKLKYPGQYVQWLYLMFTEQTTRVEKRIIFVKFFGTNGKNLYFKIIQTAKSLNKTKV